MLSYFVCGMPIIITTAVINTMKISNSPSRFSYPRFAAISGHLNIDIYDALGIEYDAAIDIRNLKFYQLEELFNMSSIEVYDINDKQYYLVTMPNNSFDKLFEVLENMDADSYCPKTLVFKQVDIIE